MKDIYQIIENHFERNYFYNSGSIKTEENIQHLIENFERAHPNLSNRLMSDLKSNFPEVKVEHWTQFFNHDRCIRYLIEIDEVQRFICQVSIFGYFSIYQHAYHLKDGRHVYDNVKFMDKGDSKICDRVYESICGPSFAPIWLERNVLKYVVPEFSLNTCNELYSYEISVADILFTNHYL
ncbi:hypothetical protein [Pedobacter aquatilis]|uniref:hypothetical protein n=1 Tax=Pedobacter aquatilis TaxID=351343 RepID=UPI002930A0F7|nr:hypothetical protein [Pedobacter aquatilis]